MSKSQLGSWTFKVFEMGTQPFVDWDVQSFNIDGSTTKANGTTQGNLYAAYQDAADAMGYIFPFVLDPDLAEMGGAVE